MTLFDTAAVLMVLTAIFSFLNHRTFRLPLTIGLLLSGLMASGGVLVLDGLLPQLQLLTQLRSLLQQIDFTYFLMHGMLGFLLFAGALHVELEGLLKKKWTILSLASIGVLISTALIGFGSYFVFSTLGLSIPLPYCLVFGALISPTDPIAVLGIMKSIGAPKALEIKIAGESLFNDGIGVVVFSILLSLAAGGAHGGAHQVSIFSLLIKEVGGGLALGLVAGTLVYWAMKKMDEPNLEILLSFALVMGITFVAFQIHASAPLACVMAGLFIGNHGREYGLSKKAAEALDLVWSFTDYTLNALLFLLLGLEVVAISLKGSYLLAVLIFIPVALLVRFVSVGIPVSLLKLKRDFIPGSIKILTWGGLRGGISVALALSLPSFEGREAILTVTYGLVLFSILVQGLTIGPLIKKVIK